jgi:hypothetical protein
MTTYTITVSIGRNVPNAAPLSAALWEQFKIYTERTVEDHADIVFIGSGEGQWIDEISGDLEFEQSHTIVATYQASIGSNDFRAFKEELSQLAAAYKQQAIAFTVGQTEFIQATTEEPF